MYRLLFKTNSFNITIRAQHQSPPQSTYEWKPDFVCVILACAFYHPNKTAIFLVDWCGRLANNHCPHYLCWISSPCDCRSYMVFTFLIVGFCRVKPQLDGDIFKISSLKDFTLKSIILPAFWWLQSVDIQWPPTTLGNFLGCIWALD